MPDTAPSAGAIHIVLAGIPGLTAGLVREYVARQSDITIVAEFRRSEDLAEVAEPNTIDVVVTARAIDGVPDACRQILFGAEGLPVIAIANDGRIEIYERRALREAAFEDLLDEIRNVVARRAGSSRSPPYGPPS